ncbi:restriction endonuclease subunit S [Paenibacillus thalictri]|uniref:Restriction endonuclease subunit S n=1 Tax=Paenibacillus thalictri TaxID=2527873 RepID=A0A4Q9E0H9_9BACL|nr:restriction endonuclease subunit S [Paenibacillus thalictri]TBL81738.1 restriction endonuclease subunit S [Paenibacillus thalictri]
MSRTQSYYRMLDAAAKIQFNIALILEAKAVEAEKSRHWVCNHLSPMAYEGHTEQVKETMDVHDQLIEVIDGLTKMENALAKNLQTILNRKDESDSGDLGGGGGLGDLFGGLGGGLK